MELNDTGGTAPVKSAYTGPVKCSNITLTGSSGGNEVRIGFTQSTDTDGKVAPYTSVAPFTTEWSGQVCFASANCPAWATAAQCTKVADTRHALRSADSGFCGQHSNDSRRLQRVRDRASPR